MTDILTFFVVFLAAFTQGVVGFGFGLVTMALLPLFLSERFAIPFVAVYCLGVAALIAWQLRAHLDWRRAVPLLVGTALGVPLGVLALQVANPLHVKLVLGVTLILYSAWSLMTTVTREREIPVAWAYVAGAASGVLGAFNTGGPPAVVYTTLRNWDKDATKSTLQVVFVLTSIIQLTGFAWTGMMTADILLQNLIMAPAIILGVVLGHLLYKRIDQLTFKRALLAVLFVVGVVYVEKALTA